MNVAGEVKVMINTKESLLEYLQNRISDKSSLEDIVDVFEKMCNIPFKEDMILFETGTYSFTGEPMFYFSLVRQFPNEEEEYYQIHVDVLYMPTAENKDLNKIFGMRISKKTYLVISKKRQSLVRAKEQNSAR